MFCKFIIERIVPMSQTDTNSKEFDFFISYNSKDVDFANWIAYVLEEAGHKTYIQAWDFQAGCNFVLEMQKGSANSKHTLALLSQNFLNSAFTQSEWAAAFVKDPMGEKRKLIPVRIEEINLEGLLPAISYIDLVGVDDEGHAEKLILEGVQTQRKKPDIRPAFPGARPKQNNTNITYQSNWYNEWLTRRIDEIQTKAFPSISSGPKMVIHLIPIEALTDQKEYRIETLKQQIRSLHPFCCLGWNPSINKDGFCTYPPHADNILPHSYVQFFKNGIIESADTSMLQRYDTGIYIPGIAFERDIISRIENDYKHALKNIGVKLPFAISITLIDVKNSYISMNPNHTPARIQDEVLKLPTVIITSWDENIGKALRPSFDYLWNNCGVSESPNYDTDGNWRPKNY